MSSQGLTSPSMVIEGSGILSPLLYSKRAPSPLVVLGSWRDPRERSSVVENHV